MAGTTRCGSPTNDMELFVTTDVGPRILVYKTPLGENVLKTFDDQLGSSGEQEWRIRGGHRLWLAPEDAMLSYHLDNGPAAWRYDSFLGRSGGRERSGNARSVFARRSESFPPRRAPVFPCATPS